MDRFWSWLGLNLGKHWIAVLLVGGMRHARARLRHDEARVLDRPEQLPQQERPGLQGQRRVPEALRRRGDGHARHDGSRAHRRRAVHRRRHHSSGQDVADEIHASHQVLNVVTPLTALQWNDKLVKGPNGDVTQSVAGKILAGRPRRVIRRRRVRRRATRRRSRPSQRINAIPVAQRTLDNPSTSTSCSTTTRCRTIRSRSARRSCRSSPTPATRRWSCGCSATSRSRTKARPPTSCTADGADAALRPRARSPPPARPRCSRT